MKNNIPEDSILKIKSDGIFGKKTLLLNLDLDDYFDKSKNNMYLMKLKTHTLLICSLDI